MTNENERNIINDYLASGSNRAATALMRDYKRFVFATALRYLSSYDDAEDITQEVFIKVFENLHRFNQNSSLKTWLYRITVNTCINFRRKKSFFSVFQRASSAETDDLAGNSATPVAIIEGGELEAKFLSALNELPEKQRETFALRYFDDLTYEEISKLLGTSVGGLKANYFQATKKLAEKLKKEL